MAIKDKQFFTNRHGLPDIFRPLLWSFRWEDMDPEEDKEDIIVNTVNDGTLQHWHWLMNRYGKKEVKRVLEGRLASEIYPESQNLARLIFGIEHLRNAR
ncbi:MAG: hypothetical protein U1E51_24290 [Candidatus Binatia bacterium]|nr:hypothetical protein [Candidatus Binatia bacterium]